ncbi:phospholipid-transporting ATPase ABCA3-like [Clytia hemisphaerica]|uniref:phospholipid-transporting ATPase ABCA3-like n=1 Tax=Clytia hemisphaerica TaxID=252671 RepID=UPI0034D50DBD
MARVFKQLKLLLWKNFLLQRRRPIAATVEILLPILFVAILLTIRLTTGDPKDDQKPEKDWEPFNLTNTLPSNITKTRTAKWKIAFAPNDTRFYNIMKKELPNFLEIEAEAFPTDSDLIKTIENDLEKDISKQDYLCGVIFTTHPNDSLSQYYLRFPADSRAPYIKKGQERLGSDNIKQWFTNFVFPRTFTGLGARNAKENQGGPPFYYAEGFVTVQRAIDFAIISEKSAQNNKLPGLEFTKVQMQRFPYRKITVDPFIIAIQNSLPLLLMLSLLYSSLCIVKGIVEEKEKRLKESMKMMGLSNWLHWAAWFVKCFVFLIIPIIVVAIMLSANFGGNGRMLKKSDGTLVFVFLVLYIMSTIMFSFLVSTFFYRANIAAAAGGILWFCSYIPYFFLAQNYNTMTRGSKILASLDFQVGMAYGSYLIGQWEGEGSGVQWSNISSGVSVDDPFTFGDVLLMMVVDCLVYGVLTWYIEAVFPGEYGIPRKFYFPFQKKYWCAVQEHDYEEFTDNAGFEVDNTDMDNNPNFEKYPTGLKAGIKIQNLRKLFNTPQGVKTAVDNVSLNLYEGEITALLGHNGAGKTTTISMLTGLFPPTSGNAVVNGYDIMYNMEGIRGSLGICPQHNVLFDRLTVKEHLWFFTTLKGVDDVDQVNTEVDQMIKSLALEDKRDTQSRNLSGGMKRKLSVGNALVGNSKVVILDEPTSGMDVGARRFTWDLLQRERRGRTILLTTHFMDEADVLGDRIAIMASGKVQCYGSSLFLKKRYGVGYHMVMVKTPTCDVERVEKLIYHHIPTAELESDIGLELSFILPSEYSNKFEELFTEIESNREELGIASYGASVTTLEEVFIKVGDEHTKEDEETNKTHKDLFRQLSEKKREDESEVSTIDARQNFELANGSVSGAGVIAKNTGFKLFRQRWWAMFVKKITHSKRYKISLIAQLLMPCLFVMLSLITVRSFPKLTDEPSIEMTPKMFKSKTYAAYYSGNTGGLTTDDLMVTFKAWFNNEAYHTPGIAVNLLSNTLLQAYTGQNDTTISTINFPLPPNSDQKNQQNNQNAVGFQVAFNLCFGMAFLASSFIIFLVQERASKAKHLQFVSGVDPISYWTSSYLWDMINFLIPTAFVLILFAVFKQADFDDERLGYVALILILYGWAIIPLMYIFSFFFTVPSTAFTRMTILNVCTGLAALLVIFILGILNELDVRDVFKWVFLFLPNYNLGQSMVDLSTNYMFISSFTTDNLVSMCVQYVYSFTPQLPRDQIEAFCRLPLKSYNGKGKISISQCDKDLKDAFKIPIVPYDTLCKMVQNGLDMSTKFFQWDYLAWETPGIGRYLVFLALEGLIFFAIVLLIEYGVFRRILQTIKGRPASPVVKPVTSTLSDVSSVSTMVDSDVLEEQDRVMKKSRTGDVLVMKGVTKAFQVQGAPLVAVDHLSLGIPHGECFGLLGQNGAGKTTTFKILTGDETMTSGSAYIDSYDIQRELGEVRQRMGYCPQFDALIDLMTGRELLWMYCRLRGVPEQAISDTVNKLAKELGVDQYIDKYTKTYSGGNKRKLSTAIALCGDPTLIFLDEPSSGMDPVAQRNMWNSISRVIASGKSIVLTSHSMDECEALCTRLAIMVNGQFKCLGSAQHLKNKFGEGYTLIAKVGVESAIPPLKHYIETTFPGSLLKDEHQGYIHYQLKTDQSWAQLFGIMERAKQQYNIEDYSVSQTTLEQVFLNFTRAQREAED